MIPTWTLKVCLQEGFLGSFQRLWAIILHTFGVRVIIGVIARIVIFLLQGLLDFEDSAAQPTGQVSTVGGPQDSDGAGQHDRTLL